MSQSRYAFQDTLAAAGRLGVLAEVFRPASAPFLKEVAPAGTALAYDLGCGPGFTTRLVQELARPLRTLGLDESSTFVGLARDNFPGLEFSVHDVTAPGFPAGPGGLIYCRMLLTHLPEPVRALETWSSQLAPGGRLLVDEVEAIETEEPVFRDYLSRTAELVASRRGSLYVGAALEAARPSGLRRIASRARSLAPDPRAAAALFRMNLQVWGAEQTELDQALQRVALAGGGPITWTMRQLAYERA